MKKLKSKCNKYFIVSTVNIRNSKLKFSIPDNKVSREIDNCLNPSIAVRLAAKHTAAQDNFTINVIFLQKYQDNNTQKVLNVATKHIHLHAKS